ncbi:glycosyltransferase family 4 protein [Flectobacillus sp. BAB-3569]|uniref:glycosyltransferase family 4 protein n=1 Tax=Flectobacillus sp. BAB-3569 TaxID=1509483 RepID=UPI000BA2F310|nr:glycosyltransferase family 4 protein [Flectobacillus sp. BAB-3569]PAC31498.1 glycosyl transferase [Flectobacillus sp. BAB-3569]
MKILFTFGGLPHYYNLVLNRLNQVEGQEIVVIAPKSQGKSVGAGVHQTLDGVEFKVHFLEEYKTAWGKPFFKNFLETIEAEKPDVIVTIWPYILTFVYNPLLLWKIRSMGIKLILKEIPFNIPKFQEALDYYAKGGAVTETLKTELKPSSLAFKLKYSLLKYTYKRAFNMVDAHVDYTEEAIEVFGSYGVPKEKIFVIYNSPDTDIIFNERAKIEGVNTVLPDNPLRLLHVGRLVKWKRVDLLMDVFAKLLKKFPIAKLAIVGTGPELDNLKQQAKDLGIEESVEFAGAVYEMTQLGQYFNASLVYVLAGMGGLSINDAMCFDKPIICSVADGTEKKLVRDGYNGYIFKNGDAEDLYQKLESMMSNPEKTKEMGLRSGDIIKNEVNIHVVIKNYCEAFKYVMKK